MGLLHGLSEGAQGDDDKDGATNSTEHAFGLDPKNGAASTPYLSFPDPGNGTFTYTRRKTSLSGLGFKIWTSTNLIDWTEDAGANQSIAGGSGDSETVQVALTPALVSNARLFIRITAQAP